MKPRATELRLAFGRDTVISGIGQSDDGTLILYGEDGEPIREGVVTVGTTRARSGNRQKVLNRVGASLPEIETDPNRGLLNFSAVFAVDTNTVFVADQRLSVTAFHRITDIRPGREWSAKLSTCGALEFWNAADSPERIGWWWVMSVLTNHPDAPSGPTAIVVDSFLNELQAFNERTSPIVGNYFLPADFELVFASADGGTVESASNAALSASDVEATRIIRLIRAGGSPPDPTPQTTPFAERVRQWPPSEYIQSP